MPCVREWPIRWLTRGRGVTLSYMSPYERRIVHLFLENDEDVYTESIGTGVYKRVQILPRKEKIQKRIVSMKRKTILKEMTGTGTIEKITMMMSLTKKIRLRKMTIIKTRAMPKTAWIQKKIMMKMKATTKVKATMIMIMIMTVKESEKSKRRIA